MKDETALATTDKSGVDFYRQSTDAASLCRDIVTTTAVNIQGKKYVRVEGWQAIALAHGCIASSRDVEILETGIKAVGQVVRMSDGKLLSQAEGFVGKDEVTWYGGMKKDGSIVQPRSEYAIRAMAQTRAISRACRSAFAHVVVMMNAGLSTTPAEEVPEEGFDRGKEPLETLSEKEAQEVFGEGAQVEPPNPYTCLVSSVTNKSGFTGTGEKKKPWKLYLIQTPQGEFGTFNKTIAEYANSTITEKKQVQITWEPTGRGNRNILEIKTV